MTRDELKDSLVGPVVPVPTPFDEDFRLNLDPLRDSMIEWVESGLVRSKAVIKVASQGGEGATLTDEEWPAVTKAAVNAGAGRAAIAVGLSSKDTRRTIEDAKRAKALGAMFVQIELPFYHHPTQDDLVRHFTSISDGVDIGILVYNTWWFCEGIPWPWSQGITADALLRLRDAEHVIGVKWDASSAEAYDEMQRFSDIFNVIDNSGTHLIRCHQLGGKGYIASAGMAYPAHDLELWALVETRQYAEAESFVEVYRRLSRFNEKVMMRSGGYSLAKGMMDVMGRPFGPTRPPTVALDDVQLAELRELLAGVGWPVPARGIVRDNLRD